MLVSAHREENIDHEDNFYRLMESLNAVAETYHMPIVYSTHPRSLKRIEERGFKFHPLVRVLKPFGFFAYNHLQQNAFCVLSDSGTLSEESAMLNFPAVLIRTSTERPEVLDKGSVVIGGITKDEVLQSIELAKAMANNGAMFNLPVDYV
ncbi:UDP-N-acetylglucosamine 2-epimerase, partial [Escherichia sp. SP-MK]